MNVLKRGVLFDNIHTFEKWGLILSHTDIGSPEPKKEKIDIPGADGELNFSNTLTGDVKYKNRNITFTFVTTKRYNLWKSLMSDILNFIHGQDFEKIILDEDQNFYYKGSAEVNPLKSDKSIGTIVIVCDVEPYKYDLTSSDEDWPWDPFDFETGIINETRDLVVDGELEVSILGRRQKVVPKFVCENPLQLIFNEQTYNLPAGGSYSPDIEICEGENILKFIGNGTVTIEYRGGSL